MTTKKYRHKDTGDVVAAVCFLDPLSPPDCVTFDLKAGFHEDRIPKLKRPLLGDKVKVGDMVVMTEMGDYAMAYVPFHRFYELVPEACLPTEVRKYCLIESFARSIASAPQYATMADAERADNGGGRAILEIRLVPVEIVKQLPRYRGGGGGFKQ